MECLYLPFSFRYFEINRRFVGLTVFNGDYVESFAQIKQP